MVDGQHSARTLELIRKRKSPIEQRNRLQNTLYIHLPIHTIQYVFLYFKAIMFLLTSCKYIFFKYFIL